MAEFKTNGHGRPAKQKVILAHLRAGNCRRAAYEAAGVSHQCFHEWLSHENFGEAVKQAEADAEISRVERIIAAGDDGSWQAAAWWLERRKFADWRRQDGIDWNKLTIPQLLLLATASDPGAETAGDRAAQAEDRPDAVPE